VTNDQLTAILAERVMRWSVGLTASRWAVVAGCLVGGFNRSHVWRMPSVFWRA
jgi:hypothetical protein